MKKLMFAAALATVSAAFAIESKNIVGYSSSSLCDGAKMTTPQFVPVDGSTTIALQDLTVSGEGTEYTVLLSTLSPTGGKTSSYVWDGTQWVDDQMFQRVDGITFQQGTALWVDGQNTDQSVRSAGQVPVNDVAVQLCDGATMAGNFTPVEIDLQDVLVTGTGTEYCVLVSKLNPTGGKTASYVWDGTQWVDDQQFQRVEGVTFAAGEGLWVDGQSTDQTITVPGVEL